MTNQPDYTRPYRPEDTESLIRGIKRMWREFERYKTAPTTGHAAHAFVSLETSCKRLIDEAYLVEEEADEATATNDHYRQVEK